MLTILITVQIVITLALILLILVQQGRGGTGALGGGGGASQTFFGSRGSFSLLSKLTAILGALFFANCLGLSIVVRQQVGAADVNPDVINEQQQNPGQSLPTFDENSGGAQQ